MRRLLWTWRAIIFLIADTITLPIQRRCLPFRRSMQRWMAQLIITDPIQPTTKEIHDQPQ